MIRVCVIATDLSSDRCSLTCQHLDELGIPYRLVRAAAPPDGRNRIHVETEHDAGPVASQPSSGHDLVSWEGFRPDLINRIAEIHDMAGGAPDASFTLLPPGTDQSPDRW